MTIRDVAARAGLSPATVSRVINGLDTVDASMAERVRIAVDELHYQPNRVAQNLRRRVGSVWGLIISDIENPFFTSMVRGVEDVAHLGGFSVVLCNADEDLAKERRYVEVAVAEQMAGVIIAPASDRDTSLALLLARGIPVVAVDRRSPHDTIDTVLVDNTEGADLATAHLVDSGYRRVAFLGGPAHVSTASERLAGYRQAMARAGRLVEEAYVVQNEFKRDGGYAGMRTLLDLATPPDAVVVGNNLMAIGALSLLAERGLRMPDDMGVVSYDDPAWATLTSPQLTVVEQPVYAIGRHAGEMLRARIERPTLARASVLLAPRLIVRGSSTGPAGPAVGV